MATVRAACPSCGNGLKFPSAWAGKAMKCQKCGAVITAKVTAAAVPVGDTDPAPSSLKIPTPPPDDIPVIAPQAYVPPSEAALPAPEFAVAATRRYQPRKSGVASLVGIVMLVAVGAAGGVFGFQYYQKLSTTKPDDGKGPIVPGTTPKVSSTVVGSGAVMPRRMLVVNCTKYAYLNPLAAGDGPRGDAAGEAARKIAFEWRIPTDAANNQLTLLSDTAGKEAKPIVKAVLQPTIERFLESSRKVDRVAIYFGGHALEKDGKAYLAAADGDPDDVASLVPLDAVYEKLKACPAQQKVVIWDVCRFNPQFGRSMPGSEPMTESLHKLLTAAPPGVQAWVTCSPGENAVELPRTGSEFLQAFRIAAERAAGPKGNTGPADAIPVADWLTAVQSKLSQLVRTGDKPGQTMMLAGAITGEAVAPTADDPPAGKFELPAPPKGADPAKVAEAFALLDLPGIRSDKNAGSKAGESLYVSDEALAAYLVDAVTADEAAKQKAQFPIRAAAANALLTMRKIWKSAEGDGLRETFVGEASDGAKRMILKEQEVPARIVLELESIITECEKLEKSLDKEPSKRWRATFQYAYAQAKARWAYMNEYNLMLGVIQKNELPPLDEAKGDTGWQMISSDTMRSKKDVKEKLESSQELFDAIAKEHKGTPWAVLAKQAKNAKLGLEWRTVGAEMKRE
jgi:hypothetical protein